MCVRIPDSIVEQTFLSASSVATPPTWQVIRSDRQDEHDAQDETTLLSFLFILSDFSPPPPSSPCLRVSVSPW